MKSKRMILATIIIALLVLCFTVFTIFGLKAAKQIKVSGEENFAGAYQEMSTPEFWISKQENPNEIIMSGDQIDALNKNFTITDGANCVDLDNYAKSLSKSELIEKLRVYTVPESTRYIGETPADEAYYQALFQNRNETSVMEQNPVRLGVIIQNTQLRSWPTADVSYSDINNVEFDLNCQTALKTCERVAILHKSADQEWLYVQAYTYIGWVRAQDTALCTEDEWNTIGTNTNWLTVTANRITLDFSNVNAKVSRRELTMGTKLILLLDKPAVVDGISTQSAYVVLLPAREANGTLKLVVTYVPQSLDVTVGFLEYTTKNIIEQSFKMLGERYGWGGLWNARDCSAYTMDIYHCFGINLPRNASKQAIAAGKQIDVSTYSNEDKQAFILSQPVGTLLAFPGHIMLYLGEYDGEPYVIHQSYSFISKDKTTEAQVSCVLVSDLEVKRSKSGETFLSEITTVNAIK